MNCEHKTWIAKEIPLSDGRPSLREFCVECGMSGTGTRLGQALPMVNDTDLRIISHKHRDKTLGEINEIDKEYVKWLILHSKASDRVKKSAARVYYGEPYIAHKDGEIYSQEHTYKTNRGWELIKRLQFENETPTS